MIFRGKIYLFLKARKNTAAIYVMRILLCDWLGVFFENILCDFVATKFRSAH